MKEEYKKTLNNLVHFTKNTNDGIASCYTEDGKFSLTMESKNDSDKLEKVMRVISDMKEVESKEPEVIKRLKEMVVKLKKHGELT